MTAVDRVQRLAVALTHLQAGRWRRAEAAARVLMRSDADDVEAMLLAGLAIATG